MPAVKEEALGSLTATWSGLPLGIVVQLGSMGEASDEPTGRLIALITLQTLKVALASRIVARFVAVNGNGQGGAALKYFAIVGVGGCNLGPSLRVLRDRAMRGAPKRAFANSISLSVAALGAFIAPLWAGKV